LKRKHSSRTQFFLIKRPSQSSLDCSKPSTTTTTPKSDSSSNHPELHQLLHRSPHDNRSLCDDRLHHYQLHLLKSHGKRHHPVYIAIMMITISRSQSRITSSTLSIWKNTYSNFNMVTIGFINTTTILNMDITHDVNKTIRLLTRSDKLITNNIRSAMSSCRLQTR